MRIKILKKLGIITFNETCRYGDLCFGNHTINWINPLSYIYLILAYSYILIMMLRVGFDYDKWRK